MNTFTGLPFKAGGRSREEGVDCAGLAWLWLKEMAGIEVAPPRPNPEVKADEFFTLAAVQRLKHPQRGDVVFFRQRSTGKVRHVGVMVGEGKLLHIVAGGTSRVENGFTLIQRLGFDPVAAIPADQVGPLCQALADPELAWIQLIMLAVALALSYAMSRLQDKPKLEDFKNFTGRYGRNNTGAITAKDPELPLPDLLGSVTVAGNAIYQQTPDKSAAVSNDPPQAWNQIVVLNSGPSSSLDPVIDINGLGYSDPNWHQGTNLTGIYLNPLQNRVQSVLGTISSDTYVPSISFYHGDLTISPQVDIRARYDRNFPVYPMVGTSYLVFRFFDSSKFSQVNITARVKGRLCRQFDENGWIETSVVDESHTGTGAAVRFQLGYGDLVAVTAVSVGGTSYTEMSASNQSGNVYWVNKTKGYIEFLTAPADEAAILVSYSYHPREFTRNPIEQIVYLLTEPRRGKAFAEDRIDWAAADTARDYCDEQVTWVNSNGTFTGPRYETSYAIDVRKPIQDHIQSLLDASHSVLLLSNGKFILRSVKSGSSVFSFDTSNILVDSAGQSTFQADQVDRTTRPNRLRLAFHSEDTLNSETEVVADDEDNQRSRIGRAGDSGILEEQLKFPAVTSFPQAGRLVEMLLRESVGARYQYTWKTNVLGLALQPGDIVDVTHPSLTTSAKLLRIDSIDHDEQDRLSITATEYVAGAY